MVNLQESSKSKIRQDLSKKTKNVLGCPINICNFDELWGQFKRFLENHKSCHIVTINPEMIMFAQKDPEFMKVLNEADLVIADGVGVTLGLRILGENQERITGIDFCSQILGYCAESGFRVGLLGAKEKVLNKACEELMKKYYGLNIVFSHHGYFDCDKEILKELEDCCPDLLLVAMGFPRQEKLIYNYKKKLKNTIMMGVGGSFDVFSGEVKRAPKFFQKAGLEWLYRLLLEPSRFSRMFPSLPLFLIKVIFSKRGCKSC